ncbi:MAG: TIGR00300 family protein, partial [Pirellulaceae bacterium]
MTTIHSSSPGSFDPSLPAEDVEVEGHIIDSLILPKILDYIISAGGNFQIKRVSIGQTRRDPSYALLSVQAPTQTRLQEILEDIADHGATPVVDRDCRLVTADMNGAFPEGFYSTTNQRTEVRFQGKWLEVQRQEMDCGIVVDTDPATARCIAMTDVVAGQSLVVGHAGVRVIPEQRSAAPHSFEFMNSAVSTEKPKGVAIRQIAQLLQQTKQSGG